MGSRTAAFIFLVILISGCASSRGSGHGPEADKVRTFADIYRKAKEAGLTAVMPSGIMGLAADMGYAKPYFPVYEEPRIVKVWVPAHIARQDKDVLVAGHWVFLMVEEPHWYIQQEGVSKAGITPALPTAPQKE